MLANDLLSLRRLMQENDVIFAYSGYVTEQVLSSVGDAVKQKMTISDTDTKTIRSVFAVFVEQMQNIIRYSAEKIPADTIAADRSSRSPSAELRYGVVTVGQDADGYVVHAGNFVQNEDVARLRERLRLIASMDRTALKQAYKDQLKSDVDASCKGAGVGFIEIARRSSRPIEFEFMEVDSMYSFFALRAKV